jgi:hypothetical protein
VLDSSGTAQHGGASRQRIVAFDQSRPVPSELLVAPRKMNGRSERPRVVSEARDCGAADPLSHDPRKRRELMSPPPPKHRRANVSALRTDVIRASRLLEREELVIGRLRFAREVSRREALEMELSEIRRELRLLGFKTL